MKVFNPLLFKVFIAIALGVLSGIFLPEWFNRILATFNGLFGQFLGFSIPLIIMGLVMPAIGELGKGAGKLLIITVIIANTSNLLSGFSTYFLADELFPKLLGSATRIKEVDNSMHELKPYFSINVPPVIEVMSALVLAFVVGLGLSFKKVSTLGEVIKDFQDIIIQVIEKVIIPLLPFYILGIFSEMAFEGKVYSILSVFLKIIGIIFILHILILLIEFIIAGIIAKKNPIRCLMNMVPAYFTALGTQSSAATIPVTLHQTRKNGVRKEIARFVIPICATIHLSGSTMKIVACAMAIMIMQGIDYDIGLFSKFIVMLSVVMIAAPGVPGGAIMAALGILSSILGFSKENQALMIALYIAMDSFGTACNVTGDGAIALIVNKITKIKEPKKVYDFEG